MVKLTSSRSIAHDPSSRLAHRLAYPTEPIDKITAVVDEETDDDDTVDEEADTVNNDSTQKAKQENKGTSLVVSIHGICSGT